MLNPVYMKTRVLPGHRIELTAPELPEGQALNVILMPEPVQQPGKESYQSDHSGRGILDFIHSLPVGPRSYPSWDEFEVEFNKDRDSWDR